MSTTGLPGQQTKQGGGTVVPVMGGGQAKPLGVIGQLVNPVAQRLFFPGQRKRLSPAWMPPVAQPAAP